MPSRQSSDETVAETPAKCARPGQESAHPGLSSGPGQESTASIPLTKEEQSNKEVEYFRLLMETAGRRSKATQEGIVEEIHLLQKNGELGSTSATTL